MEKEGVPSLSLIVPTPLGSSITAPMALLNLSKNVSLFSTSISARVEIVIVFVVSPDAKVKLPVVCV